MTLAETFACHTRLPERSVAAWLACTEAALCDAYVRNGRRFSRLSATRLKKLWKDAVKECAMKNDVDFRDLVRDLGFELDLRGLAPPKGELKQAWEVVKERLDAPLLALLEEDNLVALRRQVMEWVQKKRKEEN